MLKPISTCLFVFALLCVAINAAAQSSEKNDATAALIKKYFNEHNADSLYALTGSDFRAHISKEAFDNIANKQLFPLGTIKQSTLLNYSKGVSRYKLALDSFTLQLVVSLDKNDKLQAFAFQPYQEQVPIPTKTYKVSTTNPLKTALDKRVDSLARQYIQKVNTVGLSIGILRNGATTTYGYGETTKGNGKIPDANTLFEIGSITKVFTSVLLAHYVIENKLKLSDSIGKYLPDSVLYNTPLKYITLQMLANHTSGLPRMPDNFMSANTDSLNPYKQYDQRKLYTFLRNCTLLSTPGEQYEYSNLGTALLGIILEKVSGMSYEKMVKQIICTPLKMDNTAQHLSAQQMARFATVYNQAGEQTPAWDFGVMGAAGALRSSVHDMLLFARANTENGASKISKALTLSHHVTYSKVPQIGLGWHINIVGENPIYWHNGGTYGSSSFLAFVPGKNVAVVVLSNASENVDATAQDILQALLK